MCQYDSGPHHGEGVESQTLLHYFTRFRTRLVGCTRRGYIYIHICIYMYTSHTGNLFAHGLVDLSLLRSLLLRGHCTTNIVLAGCIETSSSFGMFIVVSNSPFEFCSACCPCVVMVQVNHNVPLVPLGCMSLRSSFCVHVLSTRHLAGFPWLPFAPQVEDSLAKSRRRLRILYSFTKVLSLALSPSTSCWTQIAVILNWFCDFPSMEPVLVNSH